MKITIKTGRKESVTIDTSNIDTGLTHNEFLVEIVKFAEAIIGHYDPFTIVDESGDILYSSKK